MTDTANGRSLSISKIADSGYFRLIAQGAMTLAAPTLIWTASALWEISKQQSALSGRLDGLQIRIESQMDGRYRAADAERDFRLRDQLIAFLKDHIDIIDRRISKLEQPSGPKR